MPHDVEIESAVLGALLLDMRSCTQYIDQLDPSKFYDRRHEVLMDAILKLHRSSKSVDILSVTAALRSSGTIEEAGGVLYISKLTNRIASTAAIEQWIHLLNELNMRRAFIHVAADIHTKSFDRTADVFELYEAFMAGMANTFTANVKHEAQHISQLTQPTIESILKRAKSDTGMSGLTSGIREVDRKLGGHQNSDLMYLAARPAMGKTAFALSEALHMAQQGNAVAFFSLEMSSEQVVYRLASMLCGIPAEVLMKYKLEPHQSTLYHDAVRELHRLPIYIDDTPALSVFDLRSKVNRLKERHKITCVFVDYIQLLGIGTNRKSSMNREQELSTISRNLKLIAKECNIPMIALSQLSRSVESRPDKRPLLSDLRESGSLEQDADVVVFLFRPEYYGIREDDKGNSTHGLGEYIIAKHRNGPTGICEMQFDHRTMRYKDAEPSGYSNQSNEF